MKTDARIHKTKTQLKDALMELLKYKSIREITVKELCATACISRATFYKHYHDCFDLLKSVESDMLEDYIQSLNYITPGDVRQLVIAIMDLVENNQGAFKYLITEQHNDEYFERLTNLARKPTIDCWKKHLKHITPPEMDMLFTCLASGVLSTIVKYSGQYDRETVLSFVEKIFCRAIAPYV